MEDHCKKFKGYHKAIIAFNEEIFRRKEKINNKNYFYELRDKFFSYVDVKFVKKFLKMTEDMYTPNIHHNKLHKYDIIGVNYIIGDIKKYIDKHSMIEDIDYEIVKDLKKKGRYETENIFFTAYAFKTILISSKQNRFREYYLILEIAFNYYSKYEKMFHEKQIKEKDSDIKTLINICSENNIKLDTITNKLDGLYSITINKSSKSVVDTENKDKRHEYMLLQSKVNPKSFKLTRGQRKYINKKEKEYKDLYTVLIKEYSPNPINFVELIKERITKFNDKETKDFYEECKEQSEDIDEFIDQFKEAYLISWNNNEIKLGDYMELNTLLKLIDEVDQMKYTEVKNFKLNSK